MNAFENSKSLFRTTLVAAALAAGIGATGASFAADDAAASPPSSGSDGIAAAVNDTAITAAVKARYLSDSRLKGSEIKVSTANGIVTLAGSVGTGEVKTAAVELAMSVKGVKSVDAAQLSSSGG